MEYACARIYYLSNSCAIIASIVNSLAKINPVYIHSQIKTGPSLLILHNLTWEDITLKCENKLSARSMIGARLAHIHPLNVPAPYKYKVLWTVKHYYSNRPAHIYSMYFIVTLFAVIYKHGLYRLLRDSIQTQLWSLLPNYTSRCTAWKQLHHWFN